MLELGSENSDSSSTGATKTVLIIVSNQEISSTIRAFLKASLEALSCYSLRDNNLPDAICLGHLDNMICDSTPLIPTDKLLGEFLRLRDTYDSCEEPLPTFKNTEKPLRSMGRPGGKNFRKKWMRPVKRF